MTIYEALMRKLGRTPTNAEVKAEVQRIIREGNEAGMQKRLAKRWR